MRSRGSPRRRISLEAACVGTSQWRPQPTTNYSAICALKIVGDFELGAIIMLPHGACVTTFLVGVSMLAGSVGASAQGHGRGGPPGQAAAPPARPARSEEHTSELQSRFGTS